MRLARLLAANLVLATTQVAVAQGQDGTPGQRNLQIMTELLGGLYDNANQAYFQERLDFPAHRRKGRTQVRIAAAENPTLGAPLFSFTLVYPPSAAAAERELWLLETDADPLLVRMRRYSLERETPRYRDGCDLLWRRDAGQFTASNDSRVCAAVMQLTPEALWLGDVADNLTQLQRTRRFGCYVDIPGVAGGRDEPFERTQIDDIHDQGGLQWFKTKDQRELGISLRQVRWPINNETGAFTRNSLVMYVLEKTPKGIQTISYGWTEPRAERIGLNLQWMLVNCFRVSNRDVVPYFD